MKYGKFALPLLFLLAACAKDKSVEDYQRDKLQQNLALYQSVAGSYSGIVTSQQNSEVLGAMELNLRAEVSSNPSNDGDTSVGTPKLVGSVRFLDENIISLSAPDGFYDPETGLYSADIEITRSGSTTAAETGKAQGTEKVKISGYINGAQMSGTVHAFDYPNYGGNFQLVKNRSENLQEQLKRARPGNSRDPNNQQLIAFSGTTTFANSSRPVNIVALKPNRGTAEDFLDLVNPVKQVQLSLSYSKTVQLIFPNAIYDTRQGYITGQMSLPVDGITQQMTMECNTYQNHLHCSHLANGIGHVADTDADVVNGPIQDIPDAPGNRQSVTRVYYGMGKMPNDKKATKMEFKVVYPVRSRMQDIVDQFFPSSEKLLQVSIVFNDYVSASFVDVKWDSLNGLLDGSADRSGTNGAFTAYIQCQNFYFTNAKEPFSCAYSTTRSPTINIDFKPPYK